MGWALLDLVHGEKDDILPRVKWGRLLLALCVTLPIAALLLTLGGCPAHAAARFVQHADGRVTVMYAKEVMPNSAENVRRHSDDRRDVARGASQAVAASPVRTYTFTVPRVGNRGRCTAAETLYTIDSVRVRRFERMPDGDVAAWRAAQARGPATIYQAACRAGDALSITVALGDTGQVDEITVHNWITRTDGTKVGAWSDNCGAVRRAW